MLHYGTPGTREVLDEGWTFTIEPMVNAGRRHVKLLKDGWTVVTKDRSLSAQWEHTVAVTGSGVEVLTAVAGRHAVVRSGSAPVRTGRDSGGRGILDVEFPLHRYGGDMASTWVMKPEVHAEDAASS